MKPSFITIGAQVERLASDYTGGRKGKVIDIEELRERARVHWTNERDGEVISIRTWVKWTALAAVRIQGSFDFVSQSPVQSPVKNDSHD